ncbi:MAG: hypothetical protein IKH23_04950 [Clostridiales bacterium]|nr:hypothetical protein [Clostridiales bacterium]
MKPVAKKLSSVILSAAMIVSLTPFPGGLLMADETEPAAPATTVGETEPEKKKEAEKPASEKPKETEKPAAETPKETKETEAPAAKETEKPEAEAPKETESKETEAPKETEKPAEEAPKETEAQETEAPEEAPKETESSEAEAPKETEEPSETVPQESEKSEEVTENPAGTDIEKPKDAPIVDSTIANVKCENGILTWTAVDGAAKYAVKFAYGDTFTVTTNQFDAGKAIDQLIQSGVLDKDNYDSYYVSLYAYDKNGIYKADWSSYVSYHPSVEFKEGTIANAKVTKGVLTFDAYQNASYYYIEIGYTSYDAFSRSVNLNNAIDELIETGDIAKATDGNYEIKIVAYNSGWNRIASSTLTYNYTSSASPSTDTEIKNVKLSSEGMLTWDPYDKATSYYVELSSGWGKWTDTTSMDIGKVIDDMIKNGAIKKSSKYSVEITAYGANQTYLNYWYGKLAYASSATADAMGEITGAKVTKGVLTWNAYAGAKSYEIEVDGGGWLEIKTTSVNLNKEIDKMIKNQDISKSGSGDYTITIYAYNTYYCTMAKCQLTYSYNSLAAPVNQGNIQNVVFDTDGTMSWDAYSGAAKYKVFVEDVETETKTTKFAVCSKINSLVTAGIINKDTAYSIYIFAYDSDGITLAGWYGQYMYDSSATAPKIGTITNVKTTNGIMTWNKYSGAVKYKLTDNNQYEDLGTVTSNSVYLHDLINKKINLGNIGKADYYYIEITAINKKGQIIGTGHCSYRYMETNTLTVTGKTIKAKRRKKKTFSVAKAITFKNRGQGKLTYAKVSGNKKISINKTTGKITVKKGLKKKTYKVAIRVTASGKSVYAATQRTVTVSVKVK